MLNRHHTNACVHNTHTSMHTCIRKLFQASIFWFGHALSEHTKLEAHTENLWDKIVTSKPVSSELTQSIDAISKCQKGAVDVCPFHHPLATVVGVGSSLRPSQINEEKFASAHLLHNISGPTALLDDDLQDGMRSGWGSIGSCRFLSAFSVPLDQHLHHLHTEDACGNLESMVAKTLKTLDSKIHSREFELRLNQFSSRI